MGHGVGHQVERRNARLAELLASAEVRVDTTDGGGSGFFVAPQMVITCAHVVGGRTGAAVRIGWRENVYAGEVVGCRPEADVSAEGRYPHPDLAVICIAACRDHPCVLLDPLPPEPGDELLVLGHTTSWNSAEVLAESERFRWSGHLDTSDSGEPVMKLGAGQAVEGMSGGPVLNLRSGGVCGVLRTSRDLGSDMGGWAIPARTVRAVFPEPADEHDAYHRRDPSWRAVAERWADADAAVFLPGQRLREDYPPSFLLRSEFEVVQFTGRVVELAELTEWCEREPRTAVSLVTGPGGQGKTRLARELCHRLGGDGWTAGFVRPDVAAEDLTRLVERGVPCLLVIDYAETLADRIQAIGGVLVDAAVDRVRMLLLARSAGDWWSKLREDADEALAALLLATSEVELARSVHAVADHRAAFERARDAFAVRLGLDVARVQPPPDLDHPRYGLVLALHMTALAMILDNADHRDPRPAWQDPAGRVLHHERRYWRRSGFAAGLAALGDEVFGRVVAAATLFGAPDTANASRLLSALPDLTDQPTSVIRRYLRWAGELHPGSGPLNALQPDRLGEDHVAEVLHNAPDLVDALMPVADGGQARQAITVLARAASRHRNVTPRIHQLLSNDPERLLVMAVEVATQLRDPQLLAEAISANLPSLNEPLTLLRLHELLPNSTVALADLALQITQAVVTISGQVFAENDPMRGPYLNELAVRLNNVGELEEALAVARRTVALLRPATGDVKHQASLANALNTLGNQLGVLGRLDEACDAYREAAAIYEVGGHESLLGGCLSNLATLLVKLGAAEEAVVHSDRAVTIVRRLANGGPPDTRSGFATILINHVSALSAVGRYDDAVAAGTEAVTILMLLATAQPDAFRYNLGTALVNLSALCGRLGRFDDALDPIREAVDIFRDLAIRQTDRYEKQLHDALRVYAGILLFLNQADLAFDTIREAVNICRSLIARRPDAHAADIAADAGNLAALATRTDHGRDAITILRGVEAQVRELASEPYGFRRDALAAVLAALCTVLSHTGEYGEAVATGQQAVATLRAGGVRQPEKLAVALAALAVAQVYDRRLDDSVESARVAIETCRSHGAISESSKITVARFSNELVKPLSEAKRYQAAEMCAGQAVELLEDVAAWNAYYERDLATALHNHAVTLWGISRSNPWLNRIERAIDIRRRWAGRSAETRDDLVLSLRFKEHALRRHGLLSQAQETAREADVVERWATHPARTTHTPPPLGAIAANPIESLPLDTPASTKDAAGRDRKVPRNSSCPCGSGRKYKRCCGSPGRRTP